jgi:hypothetical protein
VLIKPESSIQVDCQTDRDFYSKLSAIVAKIFRQISRTETPETIVRHEQLASISKDSCRITGHSSSQPAVIARVLVAAILDGT